MAMRLARCLVLAQDRTRRALSRDSFELIDKLVSVYTALPGDLLDR